MESSIAVFLWRQPACERLPTSFTGVSSNCDAEQQATTSRQRNQQRTTVDYPSPPPRVKHTVAFGQKLVKPLTDSRLYQINRVFLAPENRANLFRVPVPDWKSFPPSGGRTLVPEICDRRRLWRKKRPSDFFRAELVLGIDRNPLRFWFILPLE